MAYSVIFTLIYLGVFALCVWLAWRRSWVKSAASAVVSALSFAEAYPLAKSFAASFGNPVSNALKEGFLQLLNLRSDVMVRETAMLNVSAFAVTVIFGMALFLALFGALLVLNSLIKRLLFRIFSGVKYKSFSTKRKLSVLSVAMAVVSFGTVSFALLYPVGTAADVANSAAAICGYDLPASVLTNPIGRLYGIFGRSFFDSLTEVEDSEFVNSDEAERGAEIYLAVAKVTEGKDNGDSIELIAGSLKSSYLLTDFTSELVANAANSWRNGRRFMNTTLKMPAGRNGELVSDVLGILSEWKRENLIQDIGSAINVYKLLREHEIFKISDGAALFEALSDKDFDAKLFLELSRNDDFIAVIPKVLHFGIGSAVDAMEMEMNDEYLVEFDAKALTKEEWLREADAFSTLLSRMVEMSGESNGLDILGLLEDMYELRDSKILSNMLVNLLIQILYNLQMSALGLG